MIPSPLTNLRLLDCALQAGGTKEIRGDRHNPDVIQWFADAGASWVDDDETAWCSAFACGMAKQAGLYNPRTIRARNWLDIGSDHAKLIDTPENLLPGDIVVVTRGSNKAQMHVSIFLHHAGANFWLIGGNQSNMVRPSSYASSRFKGGRRLYEDLSPVA